MTSTQSHDQFVQNLNNLLTEIKKRAESQYDYNLNTNIPANIGGITLENAADNAIEMGIVGGANKMFGWDCEKAIRLAYHVMEDANCHTEARELVKFIPEYQ